MINNKNNSNLFVQALNVFLLAVLFIFASSSYAAGFNPDPLQKWKEWQTGSEKVNTPQLRDGNVYKLTPAQIIYYSAKENNVNPVLLMVKLQHEQGLMATAYSDSELQRRLDRATGFGVYDSTPSKTNWSGFYPQLVAASYQFGFIWKKSFANGADAVAKYSTDPEAGKKVANMYVAFSSMMNRVARKAYNTKPTGWGYVDDFRDVTEQDIQAFLVNYPTRLKDQNLFSGAGGQVTLPTPINPNPSVNLQISEFSFNPKQINAGQSINLVIKTTQPVRYAKVIFDQLNGGATLDLDNPSKDGKTWIRSQQVNLAGQINSGYKRQVFAVVSPNGTNTLGAGPFDLEVRPTQIPQCPNGNGDYCGDGVNGRLTNSLYACSNGNFTLKQACSNGCTKAGTGKNDVCTASSSQQQPLPSVTLNSPLDGAVVACPVEGNGWYNTKGSPFHAKGKGIGGADDTYAFDFNLPGNADNGKPVRAVASGEIYSIGKWFGKSYGQLLIVHTDSKGRRWSSGYMHMRDIHKSSGSVQAGDIVGYVSNKAATTMPAHLHFAVYGDGIGKQSIPIAHSCNQITIYNTNEIPMETRVSRLTFLNMVKGGINDKTLVNSFMPNISEPNRAITRSEAALILGRALEDLPPKLSTLSSSVVVFNDISTGDELSAKLNLLSSHGVVSGQASEGLAGVSYFPARQLSIQEAQAILNKSKNLLMQKKSTDIAVPMPVNPSVQTVMQSVQPQGQVLLNQLSTIDFVGQNLSSEVKVTVANCELPNPSQTKLLNPTLIRLVCTPRVVGQQQAGWKMNDKDILRPIGVVNISAPVVAPPKPVTQPQQPLPQPTMNVSANPNTVQVGQQMNFVANLSGPATKVELVFTDANNLTEPMSQTSATQWIKTRPMQSPASNRPFMVRATLANGNVITQTGSFNVTALASNPAPIAPPPVVVPANPTPVTPPTVNHPPVTTAPVALSISNIAVRPSGNPDVQFTTNRAVTRSVVNIIGKTFAYTCNTGTQITCNIERWPPILKGQFTINIQAFDATGSSANSSIEFSR